MEIFDMCKYSPHYMLPQTKETDFYVCLVVAEAGLEPATFGL